MTSPREAPGDCSRADRRSQLLLWAGSLAVTLVLFIVALRLMGPAPPRSLVLAAGPTDGVYARYAERYREVLGESGIEIEVRATAGSVENLALLETGEVDLAFVQGGTATDAQKAALRSVGSVFVEPLWIFHRRATELANLGDLAGARIAVGLEGSGTRWLALRLLEANGVTVANGAGARGTETRPLGGHDAARALLAGDVDAAFFVVGAEATYLPDLLADADVALFSVRRHEAYVRRYRFLQAVLLPEGVLDLDRDVPRRDLQLIAPTAALVGQADLHPAVAGALIDAGRRIHGPGALLAEPGLFPSPHFVDVPLADGARRYFDHGPSWLYRVFPFWLASFLDRAVILLLPLFTLLFPLVKTAPPLYRWALRRRIYRWYRAVRRADRVLGSEADVPTLQAEMDALMGIEAEVASVGVPLAYMREFYDLREHLDFVRKRLATALDASSS